MITFIDFITRAKFYLFLALKDDCLLLQWLLNKISLKHFSSCLPANLITGKAAPFCRYFKSGGGKS